SDQTMVLENDLRVEHRRQLFPVTRGRSSPEALQGLPGASVGSGFPGGVAAVELGVRPIEVVGVEPESSHVAAECVDLEDLKERDLGRTAPTLNDRDGHAVQGQAITARSQQRAREVDPRSRRKDGAEALEELVSIEIGLEHRPPVDVAKARGEERREALAVQRLPRLPEALGAPRRRGADARGSRRGRRYLGAARDERVEAGERRVITVGVELFVARQEAIRSVHPEHEETSLVRTASDTQRAGVGPADEERVGSEAENVVDTEGQVLGNLEERAVPFPEGFGSV